MTDILTRAWHILTPKQRPVGLAVDGDGWWDGGESWVPEYAAYDRLCVACERVLMKAGWGPYYAPMSKAWVWMLSEGETQYASPCQLTAAVLAIEAIGGDK